MRQALVVGIAAKQEYDRRYTLWTENVVAADVFARKSVVTERGGEILLQLVCLKVLEELRGNELSGQNSGMSDVKVSTDS